MTNAASTRGFVGTAFSSTLTSTGTVLSLASDTTSVVNLLGSGVQVGRGERDGPGAGAGPNDAAPDSLRPSEPNPGRSAATSDSG